MTLEHTYDKSMMDVFCPMHLVVSPTGHITHAGPTTQKLCEGKNIIGMRFLEVFRLQRPIAAKSMQEFRQILGTKLHLELREAPFTDLKGIAMQRGEGDDFVVNLSFGIAVRDAVAEFALTNTDFAATDLTIEILYLLEAKSATMDALRTLNKRLHGDKIAAEEQAFTDALTGLKNRRALDIELSKMVSRHQPLALMHVDLDFFKAVNDTLGHAAGDLVLERVAEVFRELTGENDTVARVGGDEFILIFPNTLDLDALDELGTSIIKALEVPVDFKGTPCKISGSIGTVIWDGFSPTSPETLVNDADIALYASKDAGRGQQTFYEPILREQAQSSMEPAQRVVELWG